MMSTSKTEAGYVPQLDGLRGIAILAVLLYHRGNNTFPALHLDAVGRYGWAGVDLFFVISGFLITGILIDSAGSNHYFRNFYMRRVLRIWPLYYALLALVFVVLPIATPALRERIFAQCHPWQSYLFFAQNFFVRDFGIGPVGVTWSLAIEEQFYLVWPLLILVLPRKFVPWLLAGILVFSPLLRVLAHAYGVSDTTIYTHTVYRLDGIAAGALLAMWARRESFRTRRTAVALTAILFAGALACICTLGLWPQWELSGSLRFSALAVFCFGLVGASLLTSSRSHLNRFLRLRWLRYAGKICFGLYLLHIIVFHALGPDRFPFLETGWLGSLIILSIELAAVFLVAGLSWRYFESPILRLKHKFEYGRGKKVPLVSSQEPVGRSGPEETLSARASGVSTLQGS